MIKYLRIPKGDNVLLELAFDVRTDVFIVEQKVDPAMEMDEYDATANHYLALDDDKPVDRPMNVCNAGRRTLPSVTTTWTRY